LARKLRLPFFLLLFFSSFFCANAYGQDQSASQTKLDAETLRSAMQRITQLEAEVRELKAAKNTPPASTEGISQTASKSGDTHPDSQDVSQSPEFHKESLDTQSGFHWQGYGDVNFMQSDQHQNNGIFLGNFNLLLTSKLSDKMSFLGEMVMQTDAKQMFQIMPERALLLYSPNEYFHLSLGRYHTRIGYYNNAYHHGAAYLMPTVDRPLLFAFADQGGVLPIHKIGASLTGRIPSGALGLNYVAELGYGPSNMDMANPNAMMTVTDAHNGRAFNVGFFAKPTPWQPVRFGFNFYHSDRIPMAMPTFSENIFAAHFVYQTFGFEFLNEAAMIRHSANMMGTFNTTGFYSEISRRWGLWRPYFRYQLLNAPQMEPIFMMTGRQNGPSAGIRYDVAESASFKLQFDHLDRRMMPSINTVTLQTAFTF
jgi:hypothetical protein